MLPGAYFYLDYSKLTEQVEALAKVRAGAISVLADGNPELWKYNLVRMDELLHRGPFLLTHERVTIRDNADNALLTVGEPPEAPILTLSAPVYDFGREVGRVEIAQSYRAVIVEALLAALLGLLLGILVYAVSILPLRALRRASAALAKEQAALSASEEHYRALFEHAGEGIMTFTPDGRLVSVNESFARMHGYSIDEIRAINLNDLNAPKTRPLIAERMPRILSGETLTFEVEHYHKDGHAFPLEVSSSLISSAGEPLIQAIHRDISERKQAEIQRTQFEARLRESQKMEALGTLAGGVAHDFNNALAMINGNVELARQDVGPGHPALESLEEIAKASRRSKDLVQQILAFSRRQKLERKPTSLSMVVLESARLLRASLPAKVNLNVDCKADAPAVLADAAQVKQILLNLCSNAAHAVEARERAGLIEVRLEACRVSEARGDLQPGRYACLTVRDNGLGMDEAVRSHLFEPFFTTKAAGQGTGLGLSVVHGIAQAHEASIEVESAPGKGSEFRTYFPAIDAPIEDVTAPTSDTAPVHGEGKHVLYIDDEEAIVFLMKRLLTRRGYCFSGYTDPREALAAARADPERFDLVVTDYNMPYLSGLEVASALKDIRPDLPVVLASGYITEELRAKAPAAGIHELIYKSNTVDDLCEAIVRYAKAQTVGKRSKSS